MKKVIRIKTDVAKPPAHLARGHRRALAWLKAKGIAQPKGLFPAVMIDDPKVTPIRRRTMSNGN